jgi:hypothetical protein
VEKLTLRVQLRAINVLTAVECNDLVADDIVARCKFGWKNSRDLELVRNELICDPGSGADDSRLRNL